MRTSALLCVIAMFCMAQVYAIHRDEHSILIEEHQQLTVEADINLSIRNAQESLLDAVAAGVVITDGQIDNAVKAAFAPIFDKCEAITNVKEQRQCLVNVATGKKVTASGSAKALAAKKKKAAKKAAEKKAAKKAEKEAKKIVAPKKKAAPAPAKKDKVAADAKKAEKHLKKAKEYQAKADAEKKKAEEAKKKLAKDAKKVADKNKKLLKKVEKDLNKTKKADKKAKKASFIEFEEEMMDFDDLHASALDSARDNIYAFLELAEEVSPHKDTTAHLDSIDVSLLDLQQLEIPEVSAEEIDEVLRAVEEVTDSNPASFLEQEQTAEAETQTEATAEAEAEAESQTQTQALTEEQKLAMEAEAEMNRDLANFGHATQRDVIDLSDLEDIDQLTV